MGQTDLFHCRPSHREKNATPRFCQKNRPCSRIKHITNTILQPLRLIFASSFLLPFAPLLFPSPLSSKNPVRFFYRLSSAKKILRRKIYAKKYCLGGNFSSRKKFRSPQFSKLKSGSGIFLTDRMVKKDKTKNENETQFQMPNPKQFLVK